ncbi:MAG: S-adenosylmethionine synthetase, partial [Planctomycetota bacterium]
LRPAKIAQHFELRRPIYRRTAAYGHFGREDFPWEKLDQLDAMKA